MANLALRSSNWLDRIRGTSRGSVTAKGKEAGLALRQIGEGVVVGAALGALQRKRGTLDLKLTPTTPVIPVDLAVSAVGIALGLVFADSDVAHDLRNAGTAGATIFSFRKVAAMGQTTVTGEPDPIFGAEDPVLAAARLLV